MTFFILEAAKTYYKPLMKVVMACLFINFVFYTVNYAKYTVFFHVIKRGIVPLFTE